MMARFNRNTIHTFKQERLAKDDISLLIHIIEKDEFPADCTDTRLELLLGKLKRMEKQ